jgi:hypothetical protein
VADSRATAGRVSAAARIDVLATPESLAATAHSWEELLQASVAPNVFLTPEWMLTWLDTFGAAGEAHALLVRDEYLSLQGIAPFFRTRLHWGPFALGMCRFLGTGVGADHLSFVSRAGTDITDDVMSRLLREDTCDLLDLAWLEERQARRITHAAKRFQRTHGWIIREAAKAPVIRLPATWPAYTKNLGASFRSTIGRYYRKLERECGPVSVWQVASADEFERAWEKLVHFHQLRWRARGLPGAFANPQYARFHHAFGRAALRRNWLRLYVLEARREIRAVLYCLQYGGRVSYFKEGFDPAYSRYGPGRLLMAHAIRQAIDEAVVAFDFLRGTETHKFHWRPDLQTNFHVTVFRRNPAVIAAVTWREWKRRLGVAARRAFSPDGRVR